MSLPDCHRRAVVWIAVTVEGQADTDDALSEAAGKALEPQLQEDWIGGRLGSASVLKVQRVPNDMMEATFA